MLGQNLRSQVIAFRQAHPEARLEQVVEHAKTLSDSEKLRKLFVQEWWDSKVRDKEFALDVDPSES